MELEKQSEDMREEIAKMVVIMDGIVSWDEVWNMSSEDRLNIIKAYNFMITERNRAMKK
jgi:hypothetical protein